MKNLLLLLIIPLLAISCSSQNKLDNKTALKVLQQDFKQSCKNDIDDFISTYYDGPNFSALEAYFNNLEKQGLVTTKKIKNRKKEVTGIRIRYTKKAEAKYEAGPGYSSFSAAATKFVPKEIIGISYEEDGNKAVVQFKGDWVHTPFYNLQIGKTRCKEETGTSVRASFIRFDTGWQLQ
ncbi:hypothetical protein [Psychroserpens algicola]|uniref:DUF5104 domain-containing protein n=1 Tax=Psychroserpens algicola TaxID=1719034 RepID=A0ABT0H4Y2_9FLAO|nr:hypothetical protein [Psychroserpens algicola]MCK8479064.1 hypothetical protein [Psychroserpens algicola]